MDAIRQVGIISKPDAERARSLVPELVAWLEARSVAVRLDEVTASYLEARAGMPRSDVPNDAQLVIVLGGDGTLLSAARSIAGRDIPLLAVNLGGLGFLTSVTVEEVFPELERAFRGEHRIGHRRMLSCAVHRGGQKQSEYLVLNDVVVSASALARMIDLSTQVDDHFICRYKADGLIVATPTGSTAYSLSAGGPIIFPRVEALAITPICPHMLTNRPVIVPESSVIRIFNHASGGEAYLTIDGQVGEPLQHEDTVVCQSAHKSLSLIRPPRALFFDVLRAKLKWGER